MDRGGAETMIMNLYRQIDRSKIQFDFLVHTDSNCDYDYEIRELGGRIFRIQPYRLYNYCSYRREFRKFLQEHKEYKIIHGHIGSCASVYLREARRQKRYTIAHSHSVHSCYNVEDIIFKILTFDHRWLADFYFGCSKKAGIDRYGKRIVESKRFIVLNNGIDAKKYRFTQEKQAEKKKELNLEKHIVFGHVGRFVPVKNHDFLLDVFEQIAICEPKAALVLAGRGELEEKMKEKVRKLGLEENVHFLGVRDDIPELMIMMDGFIFPSHSEGLGIAAVEAQAAGLPCLLSEQIPDEAVISKDVKKLPFSIGASTWAKEMLRMYSATERKDTFEEIRKAGYDIGESAVQLMDVYRNALKHIG